MHFEKAGGCRDIQSWRYASSLTASLGIDVSPSVRPANVRDHLRAVYGRAPYPSPFGTLRAGAMARRLTGRTDRCIALLDRTHRTCSSQKISQHCDALLQKMVGIILEASELIASRLLDPGWSVESKAKHLVTLAPNGFHGSQESRHLLMRKHQYEL